MKDGKKALIYGGFEYPDEYDRYEKTIGLRRWLSSHKSVMFGISGGLAAVASLVLIVLNN